MTGMGALLTLVKFFFKKVPIIHNRVRGIKTIERIPIFFWYQNFGAFNIY